MKWFITSAHHTKTLLSRHKVYIFPGILLVLLIFLTSLKISGTSIGMYHGFLYGDTIKDSNLIFGHPQSIRSDEWLVNTQMTIAQAKNDYKQINPNFSEPKDMSLLFDAPYLEWSVLFKPQHFSFFVLPFEYAFAFKWWLMFVALMVSCYFFCLKLLPGKIWLAIAAAITIACSPFVSWWYLNGTIAPLAYGFLIILVSMGIIEGKKIYLFKKQLGLMASNAIRISALSYLLIAFALLLYPPFQIPVALVVFFFLLGWLIKDMADKDRKRILITISSFVAAILITASVSIGYLASRPEAVHAITHTVYPGERSISSGGYDIKKLLVTYLQPQLQREDKGAKYDKNQSESANFILLPLFFLLPATVFLGWIYKKKRKIEWVLLMLLACSSIFLAQLFIPGIEALTKVFMLHLVPLERIPIGLGLLAIVLVIYMAKLMNKYRIPFSRKTTAILLLYIGLFFSAMLWAGLEISKLYPDFISSKKLILLLASILIIGLSLILFNRPKLGLIVIALFSIGSTFYVNPLYRGLGPIYNSEISATIQELSPSKETVWGSAENISIENIVQISGHRAVTGVTGYPSNTFWKEYSGMTTDTIYNRYAHTLLSSNNTNSLILLGADLFAVSASCERKVSEKIEYIISTSPLHESCNQLLKTLSYPTMTLYFYKQ